MTKQIVSLIQLTELYKILNEIKAYLNFELRDYQDIDDYFRDLNKNAYLKDTTFVSNSLDNFNAKDKKFDTRNIIIFNSFPIQINKIIDKVNIQLIKKQYDFQSKISIKNYNLNLNSRVISKNNKSLKLTEREIDIIIFLKKQNYPKKIEILQKEIWHYTSNLETHTVETHIYRLRKKIKDYFNDEDFIISYRDGYSIK